MTKLVQVLRGRWIQAPDGTQHAPGTILDADDPAVLANPQLCRPVRGRQATRADAAASIADDPPEAVVPDEGRMRSHWDGSRDDPGEDAGEDAESDSAGDTGSDTGEGTKD